MRRTRRRRNREQAASTSSNELFNTVVDRAVSDIDMLLTDTEYGLYPYAGVPWYSTIFGRDGIITAIELLWAAPDIAKGVLKALALTQATEVDEAADAQPGKILHEMRGGEMARLGEVPFRRYYGSVDATPLFVMLAGLYLKRSGDLETIRAIWPNIRAALAWIDGSGDPDGDGFVEYARMTERGLANQGWKDSFDSIFHADGSSAEGPIALCEVQAYVFAAKQGAAEIARALGDDEMAQRLLREAEAMRQRFEDQFWLDDLGCYALALDGKKQPCRVLSSNAGHALFAGIASPERAARLARLLTGKTLLLGLGGAHHRRRRGALQSDVLSQWLGLAARQCADRDGPRPLRPQGGSAEDLPGPGRSGVHRRIPPPARIVLRISATKGRGPTSYPVACSPQAWAAAAPFALVAAATGLELRLTKTRSGYPIPPCPSSSTICSCATCRWRDRGSICACRIAGAT